MTSDTIFEIIGVVIGLCYLYGEYKCSIYLWYVGILMSLFYIYIFYTAHLYANMGIYTYNLAANVYGLIIWKKSLTEDSTTTQGQSSVTTCPKKYYLPLLLCFVGCFIILYFLLTKIDGSAVPIVDAFVATLSVLAMWLLAHKYIEHWWLWIVVNTTSVIMCCLTGLYASAIMFTVYAIVSVLGYRHWKNL